MTSKSTTPFNDSRFLFIFSIHRSGSTYLLSLIGRDKKKYQIVPEELNIEEHFFVNNTLAKYIRSKRHLSTHSRHKIHGSYWQNIEHYQKDPSNTFDKLNKLEDFSYSGVLNAILEESHDYHKTLVIKYPSNVRFIRQLMQEYPNARYCFLVRDLNDILTSKINDQQMRSLATAGGFKYWVKRLAILFFFSTDHAHLARYAKTLGHRENIYVINYKEINEDRNCLKEMGIISRDVDLHSEVSGKKSSLHGHVVKLNPVERLFASWFE